MTNITRAASTLTLCTVSLFIALLSGCSNDTPKPIDLAIANVTVVDAVNPVRSNQTVLIDQGRIIDIVSGDSAAEVVAREHIDGSGRYIIPGLWDFHVHFTFDKRFTDAMAGLFLYYGVTQVRDTGALLEDLLPVVDTLRNAGPRAPSIWYAGPLLDGKDVVYDGMNFPGLGIANPTPEAARANIAEIHAAGASFLKNYEMDCVSDPETWLAARHQELANLANEPGNILRSRLHTLQRLRAITSEDPEVCAETTQALKATITVPTLRMNSMDLIVPFERADFDQAMDLIPDSVSQDWRAARAALAESVESVDTRFAEWSLRRTGELHAAGVPIAAGTDTPIGWSIPGYSLHTELEQYVRVGMTPLEALYSATVRPASFFGLENEMGQIKAGFMANAVLLSANPVEDITHTRTIEGVINQGAFLSRTQLDQLVID